MYTIEIMSEWIISFIANHGYVGVLVLMFAENIFPPIPSEVILPFIGQSVAQGNLNFTLALLTATIGALLGTLFWFLLGWFAPAEKLEKFLRKYGGYVAISHRDFHKATKFFEKYEIPAVFFGRMIPAVRSVISIPAGCVRMSIKKFLIYSALGSLLWNTILITLGYFLLNDFAVVEKYVNPVADGIIYTFIGLYILQVVRFVWQRRND